MFATRSTETSQAVQAIDETAETSSWQPIAVSAPASLSFVDRIRQQDWLIGFFIALCDIVCWVLLYGLVGYVRRDAFFVGPFEFVLVDCLSLVVLLQALYIVGGYSRNTETRGLTYTAEHILAIGAAAVISSLLIY
ncbi:MAG: hypothetical protein DME57_08615, partial [Verrucomicrobia bacterium]